MTADPSIVWGFAAFLGERFGCPRLRVLAGQPPAGPVELPADGPEPVIEWHDPAEEAVPERLLAESFVLMPEFDRALAPQLAEILVAAPGAVVAGEAGQEAEIESTLAEVGLTPALTGHNGVYRGDGSRPVWVVESPASPISSTTVTPPQNFTAVAFVTTYNEADVIVPTLLDLFEQGVEAYVIDNWSEDNTYDLAREFVGNGVLGIERSPADAPPEYFDLKSLLTRMEELVPILGGDWYIKHDADEARRSPWPGVTVRTGFWLAQQAGFNVVDFTVLNFRPIDNSYREGSSFVDHFEFFEFGKNPGHFRQLKAWHYFGQDLDYARFGSHRIAFSGLEIFPYKFLVRHYPVRSQQHGERKIFQERQARFLPEARKRGWHKQYDDIAAGHSFLEDPANLIRYDADTFADDYFIERLSGVGLERLAPAPAQT